MYRVETEAGNVLCETPTESGAINQALDRAAERDERLWIMGVYQPPTTSRRLVLPDGSRKEPSERDLMMRETYQEGLEEAEGDR